MSKHGTEFTDNSSKNDNGEEKRKFIMVGEQHGNGENNNNNFEGLYEENLYEVAPEITTRQQLHQRSIEDRRNLMLETAQRNLDKLIARDPNTLVMVSVPGGFLPMSAANARALSTTDMLKIASEASKQIHETVLGTKKLPKQ